METFKGFDPTKSKEWNLNKNKEWVQKLKDEGYTVYDVGLDPNYSTRGDYYQTPYSKDIDKDIYYDMESSELFGDTPQY